MRSFKNVAWWRGFAAVMAIMTIGAGSFLAESWLWEQARPRPPSPTFTSYEVSLTTKYAFRGCEAPVLRDGWVIVTAGDENERIFGAWKVEPGGIVLRVNCLPETGEKIRPTPPAYRGYP